MDEGVQYPWEKCGVSRVVFDDEPRGDYHVRVMVYMKEGRLVKLLTENEENGV